MHGQPGEPPVSVAAFPPKKAGPEATMMTDDVGRGIVVLVQRAADLAKAVATEPWIFAHRLSSELKAAEERAREFEAQANHFRDRASRVEEWLVRIHKELEQTFFENKNRGARVERR